MYGWVGTNLWHYLSNDNIRISFTNNQVTSIERGDSKYFFPNTTEYPFTLKTYSELTALWNKTAMLNELNKDWIQRYYYDYYMSNRDEQTWDDWYEMLENNYSITFNTSTDTWS